MSAELLIERKGLDTTVRRPTSTTDSSGMSIPTFATHLTGVKVYIQQQSASEQVRYGRESARTQAVAYWKQGLDITAKDQLLQDGRYWDIQGTPQPTGRGRTAQVQAVIEETKGTP